MDNGQQERGSKDRGTERRGWSRGRGIRPVHTQSLPGIDARRKRTCERREALTSIHSGHCRHVPAANGLVEITRMSEHCAGPTRATSNTTHTTSTEGRGPVRVQKGLERIRKGEVSKASEDQRRAARERTAAVGCRRGTRPFHAHTPPGDRCKREKERAREGGGSYDCSCR